MVRGARSSASSRWGLCRRVLFQASASCSPSVPPLGEFTPPQPRGLVAGPSSVSPTVVAASVSPPLAAGLGQSTHSPDTVVGSVPEDAVSLQEGGDSFYKSTLREVWINGDKIEPAQASQFITRTIQAHFPGPIYRFNDFPMEVQELLYQMFMSNHRFTRRSDEARSRSVWTMTAQSKFKHLLYNARKNAEKVSQSADPTLWRERAPSWMRRDYWETLCNIWAAERWQQTSTIMKVNRAANPKANMHTSGSVSFATHQSRLEKELKRLPTFQEVFDRTHKKKGTDQYISDRARQVVESYSQQMTEKYAGEDEQPQLDPEVWVAASGAPKKGHVYGFGHSINTSRVLSGASSSASQTSAFNTGVSTLGTSPSDMMGFIANTISGLESRLAQTMETHLIHMQTPSSPRPSPRSSPTPSPRLAFLLRQHHRHQHTPLT
ncbi:hypothetical protein Taro_021060 [Colocasia esculenta]|uniref:Uncharacterized protein n=1 Tax=Colocasia esculenta TaxID=4460 RepID=A0A843UXY4_COLES|nr:hypothetical protein [Colocasia esculenta]